MIKSRYSKAVVFFICTILCGCGVSNKNGGNTFDDMHRTVQVDNWQFALNVENQNKKHAAASAALKDHYLKATLYLSNIKTKKSLLYSISDNSEDYEAKYKYLSFNCKDDLYIKSKDENIYPIGYVFEPSNGLSTSERLVYKFQISDDKYKKLVQNNDAVEYWYTDKLIGLGKICFKQQ